MGGGGGGGRRREGRHRGGGACEVGPVRAFLWVLGGFGTWKLSFGPWWAGPLPCSSSKKHLKHPQKRQSCQFKLGCLIVCLVRENYCANAI